MKFITLMEDIFVEEILAEDIFAGFIFAILHKNRKIKIRSFFTYDPVAYLNFAIFFLVGTHH